jgi:hypothetical protein
MIRAWVKRKGRGQSPGNLAGPRHNNEWKLPAGKGSVVRRAIRCGFLCLATKLACGNNARLLNHLIRLEQDVLWYYKSKLLSRLKVDENLEFFRQLYRQITGFCAVQDLGNVARRAPV